MSAGWRTEVEKWTRVGIEMASSLGNTDLSNLILPKLSGLIDIIVFDLIAFQTLRVCLMSVSLHQWSSHQIVGLLMAHQQHTLGFLTA
jgi:hypothetical protein